jgi:calcium-dependent protein kinase
LQESSPQFDKFCVFAVMGLAGSKAPFGSIKVWNSTEVSKQVDARVGKVAFSGRYHKEPKSIEDDYTLSSDVLGNGMCGEVITAFSKADPTQQVAVKKLDRKQARTMSEAQTLLCLDHPHVVRLLDAYETKQHLYLVMERLEGGELFDRIIEKIRFSEEEARDALQQMLQAVNYLHSHGIVHRDVKLENFIYCKNGSRHLKLIDFGMSAFSKPGQIFQSPLGTRCYAAPEIFEKSYTSQCDMWSLGVIAYILLSGMMPETHGNHSFPHHKWKGISPEAKDFVQSLMKVDPAKRLSAPRALAHSWIVNSHVHVPTARVGGAPILDECAMWTPGIPRNQVVESLHEFGKSPAFYRCCLKMVALLSSDEDQTEVQNAFSFLDRSQRGTISFMDFSSNLVLDGSIAAEIFNALDHNHDGEIHYSEFLAAMFGKVIDLKESSLKAAFQRLDKEGVGFLTAESLCGVMDKSCKDDIQNLALKHKGCIRFEDFAAYLKDVRQQV